MVIPLLLALGLLEPSVAPSPSPSPAASPIAARAASREARRGAVVTPTKGQRKYISGSLGSIDFEAGMVRFVDESGRTLIWPVDRKLAQNSPAQAAQMAKAFQPGDLVRIVYQEDTGSPMVIGLYPGQDEKKKREQEGAPQ